MEQIEMNLTPQGNLKYMPSPRLDRWIQSRQNRPTTDYELKQRTDARLKRDLKFYGDWSHTKIEITKQKRQRYEQEYQLVKSEIQQRNTNFPPLKQLRLFPK